MNAALPSPMTPKRFLATGNGRTGDVLAVWRGAKTLPIRPIVNMRPFLLILEVEETA